MAFFETKITDVMLAKCAWLKVLNQHAWVPQPLCLADEDVLLIDFCNVFKQPQGRSYCTRGAASSYITR